ncbi:cupin [Sphingopyxis fribergensis]|uniref:Cupin n=1 Tax=Sphingopyxis fribergensis TaxID=1515612 RepID=A0A0A7PIZ5_9SPHN|nr:cupin domain-containing protein [Sphingopyxis fribergensis]AJA07912.1 cupin [Sphingopyxis fribergensis]
MPDKVNLADAFTKIPDAWNPRVAGDINDFQVKLVKLEGKFDWHHHHVEDELFLVVAGRMKMAFRDRDVIVEPGEFIIVPHGTEHCPEALDGECQVLLLEPNSTLNTGNVETEKTKKTLERLD